MILTRTGNNLEIQSTLELVNADVRISDEKRVTSEVNNIEQSPYILEGSGGKRGMVFPGLFGVLKT